MTYAAYIAQSQKFLRTQKFDPAIIYALIYQFHSSIKTLIKLSDYLHDEICTDLKQKIDYALHELIVENKPLAYILGYVWFLGAKYIINKNVLIPRIETEFWVDKLIDILDEYQPLKILDLCCGSGVIGLSIKKQLPRMQVTLADISEEAIKNTQLNAQALALDVEVINSDLFSNLANGKFDVIICNPPYIDETAILDVSVTQYEPKLALFAAHQGLWFYEQILHCAKLYLNKEYILVFEIGHTQAADVVKLIDQNLCVHATVWKDQYNFDRTIIVRRK